MIKNYQILKESINGIIQKSGLDIGAVYFIFKDIFRDIENLYYTQINQELIQESELEITDKIVKEDTSNK